MSGREAAIFVIASDKDRTLKELILHEQERIMEAIKFRRHVEDLEIEDNARDHFKKVFLEYDVYYHVYKEDPFSMEREFHVKRGQVIIAIFSVNSAGYWEGLQVLSAELGISNILYYSKREPIYLPS